ncbi:MAG: WXG100 family type VII secretion target [Clostridiales bacterium]|jgi:WXG100 family type VII secretion target|nr:WXG100 family type VII secretion target [Clostridiales bacterium]
MKFAVDPPELRKASGKFAQLAGDYASVHTRLINTASTMGDAWKAADNLAFVEQITGFCDDLKAMTSHLEQAAAALEQQAVNYETTRDNNISGSKQLVN